MYTLAHSFDRRPSRLDAWAHTGWGWRHGQAFRSAHRDLEIAIDGLKGVYVGMSGYTGGALITRRKGASTRYRYAERGLIGMCPNETPQNSYFEGAGASFHVEIEPAVFASLCDDLPHTDVPIHLGNEISDPLLRHLLSLLDDELDGANQLGALYADTLLRAIAAHMISHYSALRLKRRRQEDISRSRMAHLLLVIEECLEDDLTLETLASSAGLSVYGFAHAFKKATGVAPHAYVTARRLERIRRLVQDGDISSFADLASRFGFYDQSHMTRAFKRRFAITPAQMRAEPKSAI